VCCGKLKQTGPLQIIASTQGTRLEGTTASATVHSFLKDNDDDDKTLFWQGSIFSMRDTVAN